MTTKTCAMCGKEKEIAQFNRMNSRKNNTVGYYSYCKECCKTYRSSYRKQYPYKMTYRSITNRCTNVHHDAYPRYGGKGIKNLITVDQLRMLWERDDAISLKRPSIDRIDSSKDYTVANCRYIELSENSAQGRKGKKLVNTR